MPLCVIGMHVNTLEIFQFYFIFFPNRIVRRPFARKEIGEKEVEFVVHESYIGKRGGGENRSNYNLAPVAGVFIEENVVENCLEDVGADGVLSVNIDTTGVKMIR